MTLLRELRRVGVLMLAPLALAATIVSGCGGASSPVQVYVPSRLVVFGDEMSALVDDGNQNAFKYSINGIDPLTDQRQCNLLPNWVQGLANSFAFVFPECNPGNLTNTRAVMRARPGARVEDPALGLEAQISDQLGSGLGTGDLVTVLIGANDVIDLYNRVQDGTLTQNDAINEARRRGTVTAHQINRLLAINTRVILSTVPDMSKTPFALSAEVLVAGSVSLIYNLTYEYNAYLRTSIDTKYDGRNYGLVLADDITDAAVANPSTYFAPPANVTQALCVVPLPICSDRPTDFTDTPGAGVNTYLWASTQLPGPKMHAQMSSGAVSRVLGNPF